MQGQGIVPKRYHPLAYWLLVVATTTVGTTTSDFIDRTLHVGYVRSSAMLFALVIVVLVAWRLTMGRIEATNPTNPAATSLQIKTSGRVDQSICCAVRSAGVVHIQAVPGMRIFHCGTLQAFNQIHYHTAARFHRRSRLRTDLVTISG